MNCMWLLLQKGRGLRWSKMADVRQLVRNMSGAQWPLWLDTVSGRWSLDMDIKLAAYPYLCFEPNKISVPTPRKILQYFQPRSFKPELSFHFLTPTYCDGFALCEQDRPWQTDQAPDVIFFFACCLLMPRTTPPEDALGLALNCLLPIMIFI